MRFLLTILLLSFIALPAHAREYKPELDFRTGKGRDVSEWLGGMGFMFERAAPDATKTQLSVSDRGLEIASLKPAQAIVALKTGYLNNYRMLELDWGVDKFPPGASYANGKRNEAIMFYAFFGKETVDSGSMVVPDAPYFLALHLCENDEINKPELGRVFHDGGRFICVAKPAPGELVKTRFDLKAAFRNAFGFDAPPLYGIAFEFDTTGTAGKSAAFVQKINFPSATYIRND